MKYKLINKQTGVEHICEKMVIDGWDYYVSDAYGKPAIATNNPNNILNIPKVVDEVDVLTNTMINLCLEKIKDLTKRIFWKAGFKHGYNKSQAHSNSDGDMAEFGKYCIRQFVLFQNRDDDFTKRILPEWKEQRLKTLYYE